MAFAVWCAWLLQAVPGPEYVDVDAQDHMDDNPPKQHARFEARVPHVSFDPAVGHCANGWRDVRQ
jgi:hypothetical protein